MHRIAAVESSTIEPENSKHRTDKCSGISPLGS